MASTIASGAQEFPTIDASAVVANPGAGATLAQVTYNGTQRIFKIVVTISTAVAGQFNINIGAKTISILMPIGVAQFVVVYAVPGAGGIVSVTTPAALAGNVTAAIDMYLAAPGSASGWSA